MGKMKSFIEDFLDVVNNEMRDEYEDRDWNWDNLPPVETMYEVLSRGRKKKGN